MAATSRDTGPQHACGPATGRLMQIGEAAERVGLSIRTIRHYEEAGLIVPSARSEGGFRVTALRDQLAMAEGFADTLHDRLDHHCGSTS
ncbi:MerR family transcriptional regulator [Micromonospora humida]|uniref:MerR family transcriptional regulator n=1 Tax=Micromonospora humida TaxID=2809018 RepID=A0ABS2IVK9_9ACTN|nr:MerR family transcriptional regulator [Micromonospora humida]MBM7077281.1 MerR family transcriptional regulator [Micromonospora humida]